ncbi:DUF6377 domain-containing protein [Pedobacter sp. GR22-6]|uniref:DUF6377 domain-containing protein n=1 Tax=Pedobacter sp. GR22-6 TaxID=3127957 RepID=UPI00307E763E
MIRRQIFLTILWLFTAISGYSNGHIADSLWHVLKHDLAKDKYYVQQKENKIKQLKLALSAAPNDRFRPQFDLLSKLFGEYSAFRFDSAIATAHKMIALSKKYEDRENLFQSQKAFTTLLVKSGFYKEAFESLSAMDTAHFTKLNRYEFLLLRSGLNVEISAYNNDAFFSKRYSAVGQRDYDEAMAMLTPDETEKTINLAFSEGPKKPPVEFYYKYLNNNKFTDHQIAMLATRVSFAYSNQDKLMLLTLAAIKDLRSSIKETFAIFLLGQELFKQDRNSDAYLCMNEALKNASFYGTRNRAAQIEPILPLIVNGLIAEEHHEKRMLWIGIGIFLIVAVVLVIQLVLLRKQMIRIKLNEQIIQQNNKELNELNGKLWESSRIKEELIGLFLNTCSLHIETLENVKRKAQHKIKTGKYEEAVTMLADIPIQKERKNLFKTLDKVFVTLFPNFVTAFNALLKPEEQIFLKEGEVLTASLRIYALMRLGVTDIKAIGRILDFTENTVYTYKTRIRSKSTLQPEAFEHMVMGIKFTDER